MAATQTEYQTGFAADIAPYGKDLLGKYKALTDASKNPYYAYGWTAPEYDKKGKLTKASKQIIDPATGQPVTRVAGLSALQQKAIEQAGSLGYNPYSTASATGLQGLAKEAGAFRYDPSTFNYLQAAAPSLQNYQMSGVPNVKTQRYTGQNVEDYMSPYMQKVVEMQQREARRASDITGTQQQAQAVQAGAFGGGRDAILRAERERNLATQLGDIQATGSQAAFQNAQQQFNAQQQANLQANLANQQMGYNVGQQNLAANLGVQQLGAGQDLQSQLANQAAYQQMQQLGEQSKQYGAGANLQAMQAGMQGYNNLGAIGQNLYGQNIGNLGLQQQFGGLEQQVDQAQKQAAYEDFLSKQRYPYQQLAAMSDAIRGAPMTQQSSTIFSPNPSYLSQAAGLLTAGAGAYGMYNKAFGAAEGGTVKSYAKGGLVKADRKPAGLAAIVISQIG